MQGVATTRKGTRPDRVSKVKEMVPINPEPKTFFEAYRDSDGVLKVLARVQTNSFAYGRKLSEIFPVPPTQDRKVGAVREFVWTGDDCLKYAQALGEKGIEKYERAIESQTGNRVLSG